MRVGLWDYIGEFVGIWCVACDCNVGSCAASKRISPGTRYFRTVTYSAHNDYQGSLGHANGADLRASPLEGKGRAQLHQMVGNRGRNDF